MRRLLSKLFPTLAHLELMEWVLLPIAIIWLMAGISALAEDVLYRQGHYDKAIQKQFGIEHASKSWKPTD